MGESKLFKIQMAIVEEFLQGRIKSGEIKSNSEFLQERKKFEDRLKTEHLVGPGHKQSGLSDSGKHNTTMQGIELDLKSAFQQLLSNEEDLTKHGVLNRSVVNQLNAHIDRIDEEINRQSELKKTNFSEGIVTESFKNGRESDAVSDEIGKEFQAGWNRNHKALELPVTSSQNVFIGPNGTRLGKVKVRKQLGRQISKFRESSVGNVFDTGDRNFWSESVYSDAPIEVDMGEEYYNIDRGALCEIEITFDYITSLNQIGMEGMSGYPLDLVAVKYFLTDEESEVGTELISPAATIKKMRGATLKDQLGYMFNEIQAKRLRILFNQRHAVQRDAALSSKDERYQALLSGGLEAYSPKGDAEEVVKEIESDFREIATRYEYEYGLYSLDLFHNEYGNSGTYISKEFDTGSAIRTLRLDTDEHHPEDEETSIEYELQVGDEWIPILPTNQKEVKFERMSFSLDKGSYKAELRFGTTSEECKIMRNGHVITKTSALLQDGKTVVLSEYDPSSYYTASYRPAKTPWIIDISKRITDSSGYLKLDRLTEEFNGTDSEGKIKLSEYHTSDRKKINEQGEDYNPTYIDNEYLPARVRIVTKEGFRIEQPSEDGSGHLRISNMTDYFSEDEVILDAYDDSTVFYQYEIKGNELVFNQAIPKDAKITVEYDYMISRTRLRCTLRKSTISEYGRTPLLHKYSIRTKKIR